MLLLKDGDIELNPGPNSDISDIITNNFSVIHYNVLNAVQKIDIQSNLDYSNCQGPPDFLRIIGSSNFRNRYFSEMFGSFRSVLIFDCISIKNGEQGIISYLLK